MTAFTRRAAAAFLAVFFLAAAAPAREVTGLEWLEASSRERTESLARSMFILEKKGVELDRAPLEYYDNIHTWLRRHPDDYQKTLTHILASCVYAKEPDRREALKRAGFAA